ncbi:hypothetical protein UFOVP807_31 [uncultured Caudovirales phage]|uniref:PD-(D/E)XK nuclease superfamily n=1 Tax=uncultured Caudovirales phage TaxID=2100421 RepID=A0A6J5M1W1_9CAUD|nr:hypothetical protein UFOVP339_10 [uncultured Caudovirales phage]CAB4163622.1 hypothetical protein UFOVP807_31 [uncultured Caudovirales phage]
MFNDQPPDPAALAVMAALDQAMLTKRSQQTRRPYLGASMWGDPCERKLGYIFHNTAIDEGRGFKPEVLRIFDMGHDGEDRTAEYLRLAGFDLITHKEDGSQFGFSAAEGKLKGHIDGVIVGGPEIPGLVYPVLWENKELNDKSWTDTARNGVKKSKPVYFAQTQTYMAYMELPNGTLFTTKNRNTGAVYAEILPFDSLVAQQLSDKAVRIVQTQAPDELARCTSDPADFRCKFCDYQKTCWATPATPSPTTNPIPSWLRKK